MLCCAPLSLTFSPRILPFNASASPLEALSRMALRMPQSFSSTCAATVTTGRISEALARRIHSCQAAQAPRTRLPFQIFRAFSLRYQAIVVFENWFDNQLSVARSRSSSWSRRFSQA